MKEFIFIFRQDFVTLVEIVACSFTSTQSMLVLMKDISQSVRGLVEQGGGCVSSSNCAGALGALGINSLSATSGSQFSPPPGDLC